MNWGTKIFITFIIFMGIIITMVVISMRQDVSLVATDYYKQELAYQDQIDKQKNAIAASNDISFDYRSKDKQLVLSSNKAASGEIHFYRPSDASQDMKIEFDVDSGDVKAVSTAGMKKGLWKVKLTWNQGDKLHYIEKTVVI